MTKKNETLKHQLRIDDMVKLNEKSPYHPSKTNPKMGTMFECSGIIIDTNKSGGHIQVRWSNGTINSYLHPDLLMVEQQEYNSIW